MKLSEKIKHLREVEGELRGLNRPMTQTEVVKAIQEELNESISQAYLSQLETVREFTSQHRAATYSRVFKVQPGYLVSDLPDFSTDLLTDIDFNTDRLDTWLMASAEEWRGEPLIQEFFERLASIENPRRYIILFHEMVGLPVEELENIIHAIKTRS